MFETGPVKLLWSGWSYTSQCVCVYEIKHIWRISELFVNGSVLTRKHLWAVYLYFLIMRVTFGPLFYFPPRTIASGLAYDAMRRMAKVHRIVILRQAV